jgi:hypothetical protein
MAVDQTIGSTGNELQNEYKEEIINDENGNTIAASLYEWDNTTNTWTPFIHNTFTYDSNGNRIVENWVIDFFDSHKKIEKSYDSLGQLVQTITSQLDYTSNQFSYTKKEDYVFTNDSLLLSHTYYLWNDSSLIWDKNSEYNYRYNSYNKLQYREYAKIGTGSYSLVLQSRKEYIYDDEDEINGEINTRWDTENAQWINLTKLEFAKNEENKLIFEADFTWDSLSVDWIPETKEIHNYDSSGNLIKHNYFGKDTLTTQLIEEWSNDFSYDLTVSFSDLIYPAEFEYWHISKLKDFEQYSNVMLQKSYSEIKDNQIVATEVLTFYNTLEDQTEVAEFDSEYNLKVYPNPASDYVVFDIGNTRQLTTVELYDLKGNKISTQQLPSNNQVSVSKLKSGLYIYKIVCDSKISSGKIRVK